jgi:hypothetical protein
MESRTIEGKRARVIFTILGVAAIGIALVAESTSGAGAHDRQKELLAEILFIGVGIFLILSGWTTKIVVDDEGLRNRFYLISRRIKWGDISHSAVYILLEPDYPFGIKIYAAGKKNARITILLKNYSPKDVQWLITELPLKITASRRVSRHGRMVEPNTKGLKWYYAAAFLIGIVILSRYLPR